MKTILITLSCAFIIINTCEAQTKKIALRSHSGSDFTFTMAGPDDFGMYIPDRVEPKKKLEKEKCVKPIAPIIEDSLTAAALLGDSLYQAIIMDSVSTQETPKSTNKKRAKAKKGKSAAKVNRAANFPKHKPKKIKKSNPTQEKGSLGILFCLLCLPALFSLFKLFK